MWMMNPIRRSPTSKFALSEIFAQEKVELNLQIRRLFCTFAS